MRKYMMRLSLFVLAGITLPMVVLSAPPNDSFSSPTLVAGFPVSATGSNQNATMEIGEPTPAGFEDAVKASVWFSWTSPTSGPVQIDTLGSDFDTVLAVWTGNALSALTLLASNDQYGGNQSAVFIKAESGVTYRIAVYGWYDARGAITLNITNDITSKISGTVTGPDGTTPLQGISATAYQWGGSWWNAVGDAQTDASGNYTIGGLPAGTYRVQFNDWQNGNYATEVYDNATDLDSGTDIVVPAETTVTNINASLANASKISGTVTGPDGTTPLQGISANACQWGGSWWNSVRYAQTDASGNYTIGGLPAGTYRVQFGDWQNGNYLPEVYDNATDLDSGTDIVVPAETTVTNISASLANASKISGTVTGPDGTTPLQGISATAYQWGGSWWNSVGDAQTDASGNYTIGGLPAGTYRVQFNDWQNGNYLTEVYDNAADLYSGTDIVVPAETTVTDIDASLISTAPPKPPVIVAVRKTGASSFEIVMTGTVWQAYILQETTSLANSWGDVGVPFTCQPGSNMVSRVNPAPTIFWRMRVSPYHTISGRVFYSTNILSGQVVTLYTTDWDKWGQGLTWDIVKAEGSLLFPGEKEEAMPELCGAGNCECKGRMSNVKP